MNKKKIQALAVSGVLTVGVIGGTLAWFTSQDQLTNKFNTGSNNSEESKTGIKIVEEFEEPKNMLPGDEVNKDVQVKNTTTYDQFIRVKFKPKFVDTTSGDRKEITEVQGQKLDTKNIILNFTKNLNKSKADGTWFEGNDGYYYYMGKVGSEKWTNTLLDSVTLAKEAGNEYRGLGFDIDVESDSIQASNDAYKDWVKESGLESVFAELQSKNAVEPTDAIEPNQQN